MLAVSRTEVLEYLSEIGQEYRLDESNADTRWTRNRLRQDLLPILREHYNRGVDDALLRLSAQARESQEIIIAWAEDLAQSCVTVNPPPLGTAGAAARGVRIQCQPLVGTPPLMVREVCRIAWRRAGWPLQAMGYDAWQQLAELALNRRTLPLNLPGNVRARRQADVLVLETPGRA
jgi:tRNA(Ile)-lysidine synthase